MWSTDSLGYRTLSLHEHSDGFLSQVEHHRESKDLTSCYSTLFSISDLKVHWHTTQIRTSLNSVLLEEKSDLPSWSLSVAETQKGRTFLFFFFFFVISRVFLQFVCSEISVKKIHLPKSFFPSHMKCGHVPNLANIPKHLRTFPNMRLNSMHIKNFEK